MYIFDYFKLKEEIKFPKFIESKIDKIENNNCFMTLIFKYKGKYYKVYDYCMNIENYNDYETFFKDICEGKVYCFEVKKVKIETYMWENVGNKEIEQLIDIDKLKEQIEKELTSLSVSNLGSIIFLYGNKYRGKNIKEIYDKDKDYILWVKKNPPTYKIFNDFILKKERSRLALIMYMDSVEFLKKQVF